MQETSYTQGIERPFYAWFVDCLQKSICFSGRARPKEYWMYQLVQGIAIICVFIIMFITIAVVGSITYETEMNMFGISVAMTMYFLTFGFLIVSYLPGLSVCVRRIHDLNLSGWLMLLALVPGGNIALLIMMCLSGTAGENQFGKNPIQYPPARGTEFLATVPPSYIQGLCVFSFFCPVCGFILWGTTKKDLPLISKKMLTWSVVGTFVTLAVCFILSLITNANGYMDL